MTDQSARLGRYWQAVLMAGSAALVLVLLAVSPALAAEAGASLLRGRLLGMSGGDQSCASRAPMAERLVRFSSATRPDIADVSYGSHRLETYDVFRAGQPAGISGPAPVIVMVHGGAWCIGDKATSKVVNAKLARWQPRGFLFISVNYPMINDGYDAYAQSEEIAKAVAHIQAHAGEWGGDPQRIVLMGHSAGAHLVSMVGADSGLRRRFGIGPILGVVSLDSGTLDAVAKMQHLLPMMETVHREAFGTTEQQWLRASPYHYLSRDSLPWFGVCSTTRPDDPCSEARAYVAQSRAQGLRAEVVPEQLSHGSINSELGKPGAYTQAVERFMAGLDPALARRLR